MLRSLVINADDLGLTVGVNNGIFDAHDRGVLTSASVFANARATADAVTRALRRPSLGVGCHLTLVDGQPTLPPARMPSLIEDDGQFRRSWKPFIVSCLVAFQCGICRAVEGQQPRSVPRCCVSTHKWVSPRTLTRESACRRRFGSLVPTVDGCYS